MSMEIEQFSTLISVATGITVATYFWLFRRQKLRLDRITYEVESTISSAKKPSFYDNVRVIIQKEDVSLRILEEVYAASFERYMPYPYTGEHQRSTVLRVVQSTLRSVLRDSISSEEYEAVRDRVIALIDKAGEELSLLQQRKPFDSLDEPEKSLLMDILEELPSNRSLVRQKAMQLADIIKIKHQDIQKLQLENSKSATWTRWGTFGTIFFGLLSIVLSIITAIT